MVFVEWSIRWSNYKTRSNDIFKGQFKQMSYLRDSKKRKYIRFPQFRHEFQATIHMYQGVVLRNKTQNREKVNQMGEAKNNTQVETIMASKVETINGKEGNLNVTEFCAKLLNNGSKTTRDPMKHGITGSPVFIYVVSSLGMLMWIRGRTCSKVCIKSGSDCTLISKVYGVSLSLKLHNHSCPSYCMDLREVQKRSECS
uniref:Uncharacterized protein n=1 Tax=Salix viminalis TaxID=40686 RepID=A0A6N2L4I7_SALVM